MESFSTIKLSAIKVLQNRKTFVGGKIYLI